MPLASSPCPQSTSSSWKTPGVDDIAPPPTVTEQTRRSPRHEVNMCRAMLQLILPGEVNSDNKFRKDAANPDRIDAAAAKMYCQNTSDCAVCNKEVALSDMHDLVQLWTKLSDEAQVNYLASMYEGTLSEDGNDIEDVQHRTDYYLDGAKVCRPGFCAILGTKPQTLMKRMRRCLDMRKKLPGESGSGTRPERQTATPLIDLFFMELYHGAAEDLPENIHTHDVDANIAKDHGESTVHCPDDA